MKRINRILAGFLLLSALLFCSPVSAMDVSGCSPWAVDELGEVCELGFVPNHLANNWTDGITRQEFTEVAVYFLAKQYRSRIYEVLDYPREYDPETLAPVSSFADTDDLCVNAAYHYGIIEGRGGGIFDPDALITREEAAKILLNTYRAYALTEVPEPETALTERYADADFISGWATDAVSVMTDWDVMHGTSDTEFSPGGTYTREQCYVTFLRLWKNAPESRLYENVKNIGPTWEEKLTEIEDSYAYNEGWRVETDKYLVLSWDQQTGRPGNVHFTILYKLGGWLDMVEQFPNVYAMVPGGGMPDQQLVPIDETVPEEERTFFSLSEDGEFVFFTTRVYHTGELAQYRVNLAAGKVERVQDP